MNSNKRIFNSNMINFRIQIILNKKRIFNSNSINFPIQIILNKKRIFNSNMINFRIQIILNKKRIFNSNMINFRIQIILNKKRIFNSNMINFPIQIILNKYHRQQTPTLSSSQAVTTLRTYQHQNDLICRPVRRTLTEFNVWFTFTRVLLTRPSGRDSRKGRKRMRRKE
ncbi:hypothetical protein V1478_005196 [Vespula squamosa]|uniref:Ribosomal protein S11 n=1 Tax=Vespula squamosa TaxID=30214 RepID=A0ABD2BDF5_VESSQ